MIAWTLRACPRPVRAGAAAAAAAAVRGGAPGRLGRLGDAVRADGALTVTAGRDPVRAGAGGPLAQHRQVGGGGAGGAGRRRPHAPGGGGPHRRAGGRWIGVTIPLLAFRLFTPNEAFPVTYRRGRSAHLDIGGARGRGDPPGPGRPARPGRRGRRTVRAGRLGRVDTAADQGQRATRPPGCSASSTPAATCAPTAGTSSAASCCTAGWRTRSPSTPCGGWCSRRTTRCTMLRPAGLPTPTALRLRGAHPRTGVPAGHRVLRRRDRARRGRDRRRT